MDVWASQAAALLWRNALAVVPLAIAVGAFCRFVRLRPATRHSLWLVVLFWFFIPVGLPVFDIAAAFRSTSRVNDAAGGHSPTLDAAHANAVEFDPAPATALSHDADGDAQPTEHGVESILQSDSPIKTEHDAPAIARIPSGTSPSSWTTALFTMPYSTAAESNRKPFRLLSSVPPRIVNPHALKPAGSSSHKGSGASMRSLLNNRVDSPPDSTTPRTAPWLPNVGRASLPSASALRALSSIEIRHAALQPRLDLTDFSSSIPLDRAPIPDTETAVVPLFAINHPSFGEASAPSPAPSFVRALALRGAYAWSRARRLAADWSVAIQTLRDDLGRLPAPPAAFWIGGVIGLVLIAVARLSAFQRRIDRGRPADAHIQRVVRRVARAMGLRRVPETWVVSDRVSPMIWCGSRARLVIPEPLWRDLDDIGRTAIVAHELAHMRRGDHWVVRLNLLVATLFWWHPVLWWAKRRLNDEADLACDAWVTWLMPRHRRDYAEALLRTRAYLSHQHMGVSPAGMGVATGRAAELARRIKMVMTQTVRPRASLTSLTLAFGVAAFGWIATPAWSNPGDEKCATAAPAAACAGQEHAVAAPVATGGHAVHAATPVVIGGMTPTAVAMPGGGSAGRSHSLGHAMAPRAITQLTTAHDGPSDLRSRVDRLERELAELRAAMHGGHPSPEPVTARRREARGRGPGAPPTPSAPPAPAVLPAVPAPPAYLFPGQSTPTPPGATPRSRSGVAPAFPPGGGEIIIRSYKLPPRKLEALFNLMVDNDVPVPVRKLDDAIEVHADQRGHAIVAAYLNLIHPDGEFDADATRVVDGNPFGISESADPSAPRIAELLDAERTAATQLRELMALGYSDQSAPRYQSAFELLSRARGPRSAAELAQLAAAQERQMASEYANGTRAQVELLMTQMAGMERSSAEFENQAAELARQAELLAARNDSDARARKLQLEQRAAALEADAKALEHQALILEQQMHELERAAEEFEQHADELREKIESHETDEDGELLEIETPDIEELESADFGADSEALSDEIEEIDSNDIDRPCEQAPAASLMTGPMLRAVLAPAVNSAVR